MDISQIDYKCFLRQLRKSKNVKLFSLRLELFFHLHQSNSLIKFIKPIMALIRDIFYFSCLPTKKKEFSDFIFFVTLSGASGYGSMKRIEQILFSQNKNFKIYKHPRIRDLPNSVPFAKPNFFNAIKTFSSAIRWLKDTDFPFILVSTLYFRHCLWIETLKSTVDTSRSHPMILLHNDFDILANSATQLFGSDKCVCIQHGVPTDEFFPLSAKYQLVWGETSANIYYKSGHPKEDIFLLDTLNAKLINKNDQPIEEVVFFSQSHTEIYGVKFNKLTEKHIKNFQTEETNDVLNILLHPMESYNKSLYVRLKKNISVTSPPHSALTNHSKRYLVSSFSSTALIEAALIGNIPIGINFDSKASNDALSVVCPPVTVSSFIELFEFRDRFNSDHKFRMQIEKKISSWLEKTFVKCSDQEILDKLLLIESRVK